MTSKPRSSVLKGKSVWERWLAFLTHQTHPFLLQNKRAVAEPSGSTRHLAASQRLCNHRLGKSRHELVSESSEKDGRPSVRSSMWRGRQEKPWKEEELGNSAEGINSLNTERDCGCASQKGKGQERERESRVRFSCRPHCTPASSSAGLEILWGRQMCSWDGGGTGENTHKE